MTRAWWTPTVLIATVLGFAAPASAHSSGGPAARYPPGPPPCASRRGRERGLREPRDDLGRSGSSPPRGCSVAAARRQPSTMGTYSGAEGSGSTSCGSGQVAVGIVGREGDFIDQLAVRCRNSDMSGATATRLRSAAPTGRSTAPTTVPPTNGFGGLTGSVFGTAPTSFVRHAVISCFTPDSDGDGVANARGQLYRPSRIRVSRLLRVCHASSPTRRLGGPPGIETGSPPVLPPGRSRP